VRVTNRSKPILAEPDQRYWRRRANRRVRKARFTRNLGRWTVSILALAVIGAALFQAASSIVSRLHETPELEVVHIEVDGAHRTGADAILERLAPFRGRNIVDLNLYEVAAAASGAPWVFEATAKRILPGTVRVTVREREPCSIAVIRGIPYVVDTTGYVVGPSGPDLFDDLPVLTGLEKMGRKDLERALLRGVHMIARLRAATGDWVGEISELGLSQPDRVALRTVEPGPAILLDPERIERNLTQYLDLQREIDRQVGSMNYVDLRWEDRISVMPAANGR